MSELTMGLDGIRTFEIHDELLACAALARATTRALPRGRDGRSRRGRRARAAAGELGAFGPGIRALLERHGHRFVGRDLSYPTWRERPAVVVEMVQKLLDAGVRANVAAERRARHLDYGATGTAERIGAGLGGTVRRLVFERALAWCEEYYVLRENMRYHADLFLAALRTLALSAAARLVAEGALQRARRRLPASRPTSCATRSSGRCQDGRRAGGARTPRGAVRLRRLPHHGERPESGVGDAAHERATARLRIARARAASTAGVGELSRARRLAGARGRQRRASCARWSDLGGRWRRAR